jgi:phage-related protein
MSNHLGLGQTPINTTMNRIENDIETIKRITMRLESIHDRIMRNARVLGYFDSPKDIGSGASTPTPVVSTLADAINALDRAVDNASGALNVFD